MIAIAGITTIGSTGQNARLPKMLLKTSLPLMGEKMAMPKQWV